MFFLKQYSSPKANFVCIIAFLALAIPLSTCSSVTDEQQQENEERQEPQILSKGEIQPIDPSLFKPIVSEEQRSDTSPRIAQIPGGEPISLQYVKNFIPPDTITELIESCNKRNGWTSSPQSVDGKSTVKATRTSRSCPLIWPQLYLPMLNDKSKAAKLAPLKPEIELTWDLTQKISKFLNVDEEYIEPFQLVRYLPGEYYKEHHDHGSYYGVTTEQRPWTFLVFLSDVPSSTHDGDGGGYTKFRALEEETGGIAIVPRLGDGVLWKNVDETGAVLDLAVHEAIPPANDKGVIKYAMNVWIAKNKIMENIDVSAYRTR